MMKIIRVISRDPKTGERVVTEYRPKDETEAAEIRKKIIGGTGIKFLDGHIENPD